MLERSYAWSPARSCAAGPEAVALDASAVAHRGGWAADTALSGEACNRG